jgi:hypothetical protein
MKALILFVSYYGNTRQVVETIAQQINASGHETIVHDLRKKLPDFESFDFVMIGAPTRMARVTGKATGALKKMVKKGFATKPVVIFDTYGPLPKNPEELEKNKKWFYPGAAGIMQKLAKDLGLNVYSETLRCEVEAYKGPLACHQLEKAALFTKEFLSKVVKA